MALPFRFRFWTGVHGLLLPRMRLIGRVHPLWLRRWLAGICIDSLKWALASVEPAMRRRATWWSANREEGSR